MKGTAPLVLACALSASLGSLATLCWHDGGLSVTPAHAQEKAARFGSGRPLGKTAQPEGPLYPISPANYLDDGLTAEESVNVSVYDTVNRSVVNITAKATKSDRFMLMELQSEGSGSGSVLDRRGHILTNFHVVEGSNEISVTLFNGESYDAVLVGSDAINDIAVLRIEAPEDELFPVTIGDSRNLKVGMRVFALGNPFGLERTLTTGIISSLNRSLQIHGNRTIRSIIQIDAAINPGNSGGPLLDSHGRLIGINTAIATTTGQSAGVGFAIPVNLVARVVPQLLQHGHVIRPEVGIAKVYQTEKGLLIAQLKPNGPAERSGLRGPKIVKSRRGPFVVEKLDRAAADLIVAVDDNKVVTADDFLGYVEDKKPGDEVILTIVRDGREVRVGVVLSATDPVDRAPDTPRR